MPSKRYKKNLAKVLRFAKKCVQTYLKTQLKPTRYVGTNVHIVGTCRCASCLRDLRTPSFAAGLCWHRSTQFNKLFRKAAHDNGFSLRLGSEPGLHFFSILSMDNRTANVVVDLTFRQFASKSPFPLVMPYGDYYKRWMDGVAK